MKKNILFAVVALMGLLGFVSCEVSDNPSEGGQTTEDLGILEVLNDICDWDKAYVTNIGYFCVSNSMRGIEGDGKDKYQNITYMPKNRNGKLSIIISKEDKLPTQIVMENGTLYFSFPNDSILELVYDDKTKMTMLDSIPFKKQTLQDIISANNYDDFKSSLSNIIALLNNASKDITVIQGFKQVIDVVVTLNYNPESRLVDELQRQIDGNYDFAGELKQWYDDNVVSNVYYKLALWTGNASFKVGGSSCTLSGSIWCPISTFNNLGTYGIVCDTKKENLYVGKAEYEGIGYQGPEDLSFGVDFRGLKPNTTYYYRAYYKFNSSNHGGLVFQYGNPTDETGYDTIIKSFTTGDNALTVDVVMAIDCTGSMSSIINTVKRNAINFYDLFKESCDKAGIILTGLNSQMFFFRDKNVDGSNWFGQSPVYQLPEEKNYFDNYVNGLYASGGGDIPESGLEVLDAAFNKTDWSIDDGYHRQVIILWTDAPYLSTAGYTDLNIYDLEAKWNKMPSGRRLILFAPRGTYGSNSGSWSNLDSWKNLIHETDLTNGFNNFQYILDSIIGELTSKSKPINKVETEYVFRPNE